MDILRKLNETLLKYEDFGVCYIVRLGTHYKNLYVFSIGIKSSEIDYSDINNKYM